MNLVLVHATPDSHLYTSLKKLYDYDLNDFSLTYTNDVLTNAMCDLVNIKRAVDYFNELLSTGTSEHKFFMLAVPEIEKAFSNDDISTDLAWYLSKYITRLSKISPFRLHHIYASNDGVSNGMGFLKLANAPFNEQTAEAVKTLLDGWVNKTTSNLKIITLSELSKSMIAGGYSPVRLPGTDVLGVSRQDLSVVAKTFSANGYIVVDDIFEIGCK